MSIWQELRRRRVLRVAATYFVVAWVLIQVASLLEATLELPNWFDKAVFAALLLGFPAALLLSWAYDVSPDSARNAPAGKSTFVALLGFLLLGGLIYTYVLFQEESVPVSAGQANPSIAVLPFADMSPNSDQAWFADGVAEEILNVLARTQGLKVASRTASFRYRGAETDIKAVAAELDVKTILEGSVRSQGNQLRITAQLINAADGFHLWSGTFDQELDDIFIVQDEISAHIAKALFGELGISALPPDRFHGTESIDAYTHYLKGLEKINSIDSRDLVSAVPDFEQAVAIDPNFADAWAALARAERSAGIAEQRRPSSSRALKRALALDPNNVGAIGQLAHYNWGELRWLESEQLFLRAIDLGPNDADVHHRYASFLRSTGRMRRALEQFMKAKELGSTNVRLVTDILNTYVFLGQFAEARKFFEASEAELGLENMLGTEAYFVSLLEDGMEADARRFAALDLPSRGAKAKMQYFLDRIDGDPEAGNKLLDSTMQRISAYGRPRWGDIESMLLAGNIEMARKYVVDTQGYGWSIPPRFTMHVNDEVDPRYLPYKPNMLLLLDLFPGVPEAFMDVGVDILALGREKQFLD